MEGVAQLPPMRFLFDLELPGADEDDLMAIAAACSTRRHWPIRFTPAREERRWFGLRKAYPAVLELPEVDLRAVPASVLAQDAAPDAALVPFAPAHRERLATTLATIGQHAPAGFWIRASWVGSPIERDEHVTLAELCDHVRGGGLNEFTRYRVTAEA